MLQEASAISFAAELVTYPSTSLSGIFEPDFHDPEPSDSPICTLTCCTAIDQGKHSLMGKKGLGFFFSPISFCQHDGSLATCLLENDAAVFVGVRLGNL